MITITKPQINTSNGKIEVTSTIDEHPIFVRWTGSTPPPTQAAGDAMLCFGLIPAMAQHRDLKINAPVSPQLIHHSHTLQDILLRWYPDRFQRINIIAEPPQSPPPPPPNNNTATTFTGGIDSMFTLLTAKPSHAVYIHGFDIKLSDTHHRQLVSLSIQSASSAASVHLIEAETNLRHYTDLHTNWLTEFVSAALAGVGHLLSGTVGSLLIPSSNSFDALPFIGSDPLLDPLYTGDSLQIIHHAADFSRIEKTIAISDWPIAQSHLRVCGTNLPGQLNCGHCEKCARTLLILETIDALEKFIANFSNPLPSTAAIAIEVDSAGGKWTDWIAMHKVATQKNPTSQLTLALGKKIAAYQNEQLTRTLRPYLESTISSDHWNARWPKFRTKILNSIIQKDPQWIDQRIEKYLPTLREPLAKKLATDPHWLKKRLRKATWHRLWRRS